MKIIKQGPFECKLAVIAMLADVSMEEVRRVACEAAGVDCWYNIFNVIDLHIIANKDLYWKGVNACLSKWNVPVSGGDILTSMNMEVFNYYPDEKPDLSGKGEIILLFDIEMRTGHSMAFEDGLVYDPEQDGPVTFEYWVNNILDSNRTINGISIIKKKILVKRFYQIIKDYIKHFIPILRKESNE